jgi:hypothetical protein
MLHHRVLGPALQVIQTSIKKPARPDAFHQAAAAFVDDESGEPARIATAHGISETNLPQGYNQNVENSTRIPRRPTGPAIRGWRAT